MLLSNTHKIANIVNGSLSIEEEIKFKGVCTDTRQRVADRLFIALEGENFDGHLFTQNAEELAKIMAEIWKTNDGGPDLEKEKGAKIKLEGRIKKFGEEYYRTIMELAGGLS